MEVVSPPAGALNPAEATVAAMGIDPLLMGRPRLTVETKEKAAGYEALIRRQMLRAISGDPEDGEVDEDEQPFDFKAVSKALVNMGSRDQIAAFNVAFPDPTESAAVQAIATRIMRYLYDHLPRRQRLEITGPVDVRQSDVVVNRFRRLWEVACNPLVIIKEIASGSLSRDQVRAVEDLWPGVYASMRKAVLLAISKIKSRRKGWEPTRGKDLTLRTFMQTDVIDPQLAAEIESVKSEGQPEPAPERSRNIDLKNDSLATQGQRLANLGAK